MRRPQKERKQPAPFFLNDIDCRGRLIAPAVLSAATEIGPGAMQYAEKLLVDPAVAISVFEEAAATVTQILEAKIVAGEPQVENLQAYLFRTFSRLVNAQTQPALSLEQMCEQGGEPAVDGTARLHAALLLNRVLEACDPFGRYIAGRRLEGLHWDEIGDELGISGHAARVRFSKALQRARETLNIQKPKREAKSYGKKSLLRADFSPACEEAFGRELPES